MTSSEGRESHTLLGPLERADLNHFRSVGGVTYSPESASELYRPSDRRLPAKLLSAFADRGVSRSQRSGSPSAIIFVF
jgi:hypothetical protein